MDDASQRIPLGLLHVPADSFIADTAVKIERLTRDLHEARQALTALNKTSEIEINSLGNLARDIQAQVQLIQSRAEMLATKDELEDALLLSRRSEVMASQTRDALATFVTKGDLATALGELDSTCRKRHNCPEEDYNRLHVRLKILEDSRVAKYDTSWLYGVAMFAIGVISCAFYFAFLHFR